MSEGLTEIFVYGTLQRAGGNHGQLAGQRWVAEARTQAAYRLYALDGYPGMVAAGPGKGRRIPGEIWAVDAACLTRLDQFEGVSEGLYCRALVQLEMSSEQRGQARSPGARLETPSAQQGGARPPGALAAPGVQTYLYLQSVTGRPELARWGPAGGEPR